MRPRCAPGNAGVGSDAEVVEPGSGVAEWARVTPAGGFEGPFPRAELPTGARFGTLVPAVREPADPHAADLAVELRTQIDTHSVWWPVNVSAAQLADALVPMHDTPLGPLADGLTLRQIGLSDRL